MKTAAPNDDSLLQRIAHVPAGLCVSEMESILKLSRRTLQRKLKVMVEAGLIVKCGKGRATRYTVGAHVHGGYRHTTLLEYLPNQDAYISASMRQEFLLLNRQTRLRHAASLRGHPATPLAAAFWPCWARVLAWNSARLGGCQYELTEAEELLETSIPLPRRPASDAQSLLNHREAIRLVAAPDIRLDELTLRNLHAMLTDNLLADPVEGGMLRQQPFTGEPEHPAQVLRLMLERCNAIEDPFEQSFFLFLHLSCLQLFGHGNARLARIAANLPLLRAGLCPLTFTDFAPARYQDAFHGKGHGPALEPVRELFRDAYRASCVHMASLPPPGAMNPLRLRYRQELNGLMRDIVLSPMGQAQARQYLATAASGREGALPDALRELALQELEALHAGNIYRYGLALDDLLAWKKLWSRG